MTEKLEKCLWKTVIKLCGKCISEKCEGYNDKCEFYNTKFKNYNTNKKIINDYYRLIKWK